MAKPSSSDDIDITNSSISAKLSKFAATVRAFVWSVGKEEGDENEVSAANTVGISPAKLKQSGAPRRPQFIEDVYCAEIDIRADYTNTKNSNPNDAIPSASNAAKSSSSLVDVSMVNK